MNKRSNKRYSVTLLSIPNIWLNFYVYGFFKHPDVNLILKPQKEYSQYNFSNKMVTLIECNKRKQIIMIDTDDPNESHLKYLGFDYVFLSQKLIELKPKYPDNVFALNPHFPFRHQILNKLLIQKFYWLKTPKECLVYFRQNLRLKKLNSIIAIRNLESENTVFYYRSLWKKELHTNLLGALFLDHFKNIGYNVIGGLSRKGSFRTNNKVIDKYVVQKRLNNGKYLRYFAKSKFVLNTPAVRGALSWRFAEYLFANKKIISTPIKVEIPNKFDYFLIEDDSAKGFLQGLAEINAGNLSLDNKELVNQVLFPQKQIDFILEKIFKLNQV
jgi:hypothetical protein